MPLLQGLVQVLERSRGLPNPLLTLTQVAASDPDFVLGAKGTTEHPVTVALLEPLALLDIGFTPRHVFAVMGINPPDCKAPCLKYLKERNPVHTG
jgi:hypothetical protein